MYQKYCRYCGFYIFLDPCKTCNKNDRNKNILNISRQLSTFLLVFNDIFIFNRTIACSLRFYIFLIKLFWRALGCFIKKFRNFECGRLRVKKYFIFVE